MYPYILFLHILAATVWAGGHLILSIIILPKALKEKTHLELLRFESGYEKIGIPSLIIQVISGFWLAYHLMPDVSMWFEPGNPVARSILLKLGLLLLTILFAVDARLRIIPKLTPEKLPALAWHIIPVTIISVLFVVAGVSFRTGGLF